MKKIIKARILLMAAKSVHMNIMIFDFILRNPFSATTALTCFIHAEYRLRITEANNMVVGLASIPKKVPSLKKLSSPPVVAVLVDAIKSRRICIGS